MLASAPDIIVETNMNISKFKPNGWGEWLFVIAFSPVILFLAYCYAMVMVILWPFVFLWSLTEKEIE